MFIERCAWMTGKSDTKYNGSLTIEISFLTFPKTFSNRHRCVIWIQLCGRHDQHDVYKSLYISMFCTNECYENLWGAYISQQFSIDYRSQMRINKAKTSAKRNAVSDTFTFAAMFVVESLTENAKVARQRSSGQ